ncbi:MAG: PA14 domain-containing protein [Pirellulaceae bacterium]
MRDKTGRRDRHAIVLGLLSLFLACPAFPADRQGEFVAPGLPWVRFNSSQFIRPRDAGMAKQIDVDTGTTFKDYSQIWVGLIEIPTEQLITFIAEADDGLRLIFGDTSVIDGWATNGARRGTFRAEAGKRVSVRVEYFQDGGTGHLRLYWEWQGHARELIPATALFHTAQQEEYVQAVYNGKMAPMAYQDRSIIYQSGEGIPGQAPEKDFPVQAQPGPHLLLDDYLIAESSGIERVVLQPPRDPAIPNPIVTGPEDGCFQPFFTVLRDPKTGRWRIWYGASRDDRNTSRSHLATMESDDGIHFIRPRRICDTPEIQFGSEVIDRGVEYPDPSSRYVHSYWLGGGLRLLASPDGLTWRPLLEGVVLIHNHDITGIDWDPIRKVYVATVSTFITGPNWRGKRRTTMMSFSKALVHWERPWFVLTANDKLDEGNTQFYAMDGYLTRGSLRIAMDKVLRDDLRATGTQPGSFGRAHTSLAWSRDGRTWVRDRAKFFEPDDDPQAWDHAHAWIDEQLIVDDIVYLYYGGYKQGHKVNRFEERQIGLVRMPLDRYVARRASGSVSRGRLKTVPFKLDESTCALQVNANAAAGSLRVQVRDAKTDDILPGMSFADCKPVAADGLRQSVRWRRGKLSALAGKTVQLEFEMTDADLFGFEFVRQAAQGEDVGEQDAPADADKPRR